MLKLQRLADKVKKVNKPMNKLFKENALVDPFNRRITYLRLSVTDRCDLRCTYCMSEKMTFLNKKRSSYI